MKLVTSCLSAAITGLLLSTTSIYAETDRPDSKADISLTVTKKDKEEPKWDVTNPPGEKKSIQIKTTESTWSNVDVSPDGKSIIFDMLGDIYIISAKGGKAKPLTNGLA